MTFAASSEITEEELAAYAAATTRIERNNILRKAAARVRAEARAAGMPLNEPLPPLPVNTKGIV